MKETHNWMNEKHTTRGEAEKHTLYYENKVDIIWNVIFDIFQILVLTHIVSVNKGVLRKKEIKFDQISIKIPCV